MGTCRPCGRLAVTNELSAHGAFEDFVVGAETGVVDAPRILHFVCEIEIALQQVSDN
jgi:hypothetical protein